MGKKKVTKKPSGLTISRNGDDFTCQWKTGESYESQTFEYSIANKFKKVGKKTVPAWNTTKNKTTKKKSRKWEDKTIKKAQTSIKLKNHSNIAAIAFRVKGKAKGKSACDPVTKEYIIVKPNKPSLSASLTNANTTTFSWQTSVDNKTTKHFAKNVSQTLLLDDWNETKISKIEKKSWKGQADRGANSSVDIEETGWTASNYSHTRYFRIKAVGWAGLESDWVYANHVYAIPDMARNIVASRDPLNDGVYTISVSWDSPETVAKPIDTVTVEYTKTVPTVRVATPIKYVVVENPTGNPHDNSYYEKTEDGEYILTSDTEVDQSKTYYTQSLDDAGTLTMIMSCPTSGLNWSSVADAGGKSGNRATSFSDDTAIPNDQCLYLRVLNKHDSNTTPSGAVLVENGTGKIEKPGTPVAVIGQISNLYTVSCSRNTSIDNAAIAVYFRTSSKPGESQCIGVIKPQQSSTDCIIPEVPSGDSISFGVQTFVGDYMPYNPPSGSTTPTIFTPTMIMKSDIVWDSGVPLPPSDLNVSAVNESTVRVSWKWSWTDATQAELSWADHEDAWESTSEPSTYIVNNTNAGQWNIAGLSVGTWYIRVRLLKTDGDSTTYGAYSPIQTIKLASSPDTPSLVLSNGVISSTGSVTCYWAYVSGDGTGQKQGEICEAFPQYAVVENPTGNPYNNVYYERIDLGNEQYKYIRSMDTTVQLDPPKTYYKTTGEVTYGKVLRSTDSAQHITLDAQEFKWLPGETHHLAVRVMSMSGEMSGGWSAPVPVSIADELKVEILSTSLEYKTISIDVADGEPPETITQFSMKDFPLNINLNDLPTSSTVTCIIDRADDYHVERPDGSDLDGFKGETIHINTYSSSAIEINQNDPGLIGVFDDGASYRITIILNDAYGRSVRTEKIPTGSYIEIVDPEGSPMENGYYVLVNNEYILTTDTEPVQGTTYYSKEYVDEFFIHWDHQAIMPEANISLDRENNITMIEPIRPLDGYAEGDVVDIYRLSADPPEMIYSGALMTDPPTKYVDPYPTFGDFGGHRIVYRTKNGDYITEDNEIAFTDYVADENPEYKHDRFGIVIDFDGEQLVLPYNVSLSNSWKKDYTMTKYLGGSIQGDWNPAVERTTSANTVIPVESESENVESLRRLAVYPGICHVRTPDGSSFAANVDVKDDREEKWTTRLAKVSLDINKCEPEGYDAVTYTEWVRDQDNT